jgi:hypothetical protein
MGRAGTLGRDHYNIGDDTGAPGRDPPGGPPAGSPAA